MLIAVMFVFCFCGLDFINGLGGVRDKLCI